MRPTSARWLVAVLAVGVLLAAVPGLLAPAVGDGHPVAADGRDPGRPGPPLVAVEPNSSERLWPYTSRSRSTEAATLPVNLVVHKNAAYVRYLLVTSTDATWEVGEPRAANASAGNGTAVESGLVLNGTSIEWTGARGSTRYTYVLDVEDGEGRWLRETYQLHDGSYLGKRYHLRLYEGGSGDARWTAIQAHREHWDWFRLRHTVDSVDRAQDHVEEEFFGRWFLESVARERYANGGALDADGWVSVIRLTDRGVAPLTGGAVAALLLGPVRRIRGRSWPRVGPPEAIRDPPFDLRYLALVGLLGVLPLAIRVGGISLERAFPATSPKVFAVLLYLVLAVGIPAGTYVLSRSLEAEPAAIAASVAFGAGMLADYAYLDISVLSIDVVVHRAVLLGAVALVAASAASGEPAAPLARRRLLVTGALLWIAGLIVPLLGLV